MATSSSSIFDSVDIAISFSNTVTTHFLESDPLLNQMTSYCTCLNGDVGCEARMTSLLRGRWSSRVKTSLFGVRVSCKCMKFC